MPIVLDIEKKDFNNDLRFCFYNLENISNPKGPFRINDTITFDVVVFNPTSDDLKNILVKICKGQSTEFKNVEKVIRELRSGTKEVAARVTARIISDPEKQEFYGQLAEINLSLKAA